VAVAAALGERSLIAIARNEWGRAEALTERASTVLRQAGIVESFATSFEETLRRLAVIEEGFVEHEAGLGLGHVGMSTLDAKTVSLIHVGVSVAIGSSAVCLEWSVTRALAAGATEGEIADVLPAIAPVVGLGRVVSATPDVATALGYDIEAALEEPNPGH